MLQYIVTPYQISFAYLQRFISYSHHNVILLYTLDKNCDLREVIF